VCQRVPVRALTQVPSQAQRLCQSVQPPLLQELVFLRSVMGDAKYAAHVVLPRRQGVLLPRAAMPTLVAR